MSKNKRKNGSEVEYLRGEVRRLKAELKFYKRRKHFDDVTEEVEETPDNICEVCGKGIIQEFDLKFILLKKCSICNYQERVSRRYEKD